MKISRLLNKTSKDSSLKKLFSFSFVGFITFILSFLTSCNNKNGLKNKMDTNTTKPTFNIEKSTIPISETSPQINPKLPKKDCGPTPGYPCGTKYYTVSIKDFKKT